MAFLLLMMFKCSIAYLSCSAWRAVILCRYLQSHDHASNFLSLFLRTLYFYMKDDLKKGKKYPLQGHLLAVAALNVV